MGSTSTPPTAAVGALSLPAVAGAATGVALPAEPDAELFRLLDAWGPARAADERAQALWDVFIEQEPEAPKALHFRFGDDFGVPRCVERKGDGAWIDLYDRAAAEQ